MKDDEYLKELFDKYIPTINSFNDLSESFYSQDEYIIRHKIFKKILKEYRNHRFNLWCQNLKEKMSERQKKTKEFFYNLKLKIKKIFTHSSNKKKKKYIESVVKKYNKLKQNGEFLPKKID